jgi:hypothetical protein
MIKKRIHILTFPKLPLPRTFKNEKSSIEHFFSPIALGTGGSSRLCEGVLIRLLLLLDGNSFAGNVGC